MVGSLVVACVVAYIGPLPSDITRAFERYLVAALFGYMFVLTADVASRFLGGGVAAIAVSDPSHRWALSLNFRTLVDTSRNVLARK